MLLQAEIEIGKLPDGVIYLYHADQPSAIEPLIRFAYRRVEVSRVLEESDGYRASLGGACGHNLAAAPEGYRLVISTSAHGFFAILTSENRSTVKILQQDARRAVQLNTPVRF
jgi:hypothetical protein